MGSIGLGASLAIGRSRSRIAPVFDFTAGVLPRGATLTRASPGSFIDAGGRLSMAAADVARFDHATGSAALRGLIVEPQRTNLLLQSGAVSGANWSSSGSTVAVDVAAAPDGTATADRVTMAANGLLQQLVSASQANKTLTVSAWVRSAQGTAATFRLKNTHAGVVDNYSPTLTATAAWQRFAFTVSNASSAGNGQYGGLVTAGSSTDLHVWGLQLEEGASATSTMATTTDPVTRAADLLVLDWRSRGVPDGPVTIRYTFDTGATQDVATIVSAGRAPVPVALARAWLLRAERV